MLGAIVTVVVGLLVGVLRVTAVIAHHSTVADAEAVIGVCPLTKGTVVPLVTLWSVVTAATAEIVDPIVPDVRTRNTVARIERLQPDL